MDVELRESSSPMPDAQASGSGAFDGFSPGLKIMVYAACSGIILAVVYILIKYFTRGQTSSGRRPRQTDEEMIMEDSSPYIRIIEARSDNSFDNATWNSSSEIPVVIVNVGEDGKACLGWAEDEIDNHVELTG